MEEVLREIEEKTNVLVRKRFNVAMNQVLDSLKVKEEEMLGGVYDKRA